MTASAADVGGSDASALSTGAGVAVGSGSADAAASTGASPACGTASTAVITSAINTQNTADSTVTACLRRTTA